MASTKAQNKRANDAGKRFKDIGGGVFGGFKRGTPNGPEPTRKGRDRSLGSCGRKRAA